MPHVISIAAANLTDQQHQSIMLLSTKKVKMNFQTRQCAHYCLDFRPRGDWLPPTSTYDVTCEENGIGIFLCKSCHSTGTVDANNGEGYPPSTLVRMKAGAEYRNTEVAHAHQQTSKLLYPFSKNHYSGRLKISAFMEFFSPCARLIFYNTCAIIAPF